MTIKVFSESPEETQKIASFFINAIWQQKDSKRKQACLSRQACLRRQALVISLEGNLGSGKTEFLKGIAKGIRLKEKVFSPTFLIMKRFPLKHKVFKFLWHLDCYRLKKISEMRELDFQVIIKNPQNIIFIEWGDKIKRLLPKNHWTIKFQIKSEKERLLEFHL